MSGIFIVSRKGLDNLFTNTKYLVWGGMFSVTYNTTIWYTV